jgi:hypothetical protein
MEYVMNDRTDHLDQTDEDILTYTVSDEALEAAAGRTAAAMSSAVTAACPGCTSVNPCC